MPICGMPICISIPTGTIKSKNNWILTKQSLPFQFLLVRLKEQAPVNLEPSEKFQFLLVRLKDLMLFRDIKKPPPFQFLLVRLKVAFWDKQGNKAQVFQFLLVRLKEGSTASAR